MSTQTLIRDALAEYLRMIYSLGSRKTATAATRITAILTLLLSLYPIIMGSIHSHSFLTQLQRFTKWNALLHNAQVEDVVCVMDEQLPPTKWPLAHMTDMHPGADGQTRIVTL